MIWIQFEMTKAIIDLALELKYEKSDASISSIIQRVDKPELNKKGKKEIKSTITCKKCVKNRIFLIDSCKDYRKSSE